MRIPALLKTLPQKVLCALCSGKSYSGALEDKGEKKFHNPCVLFKETFFFCFFFPPALKLSIAEQPESAFLLLLWSGCWHQVGWKCGLNGSVWSFLFQLVLTV